MMKLWKVDFQREEMMPLIAKFFKAMDSPSGQDILPSRIQVEKIYMSRFYNIKSALNNRVLNTQWLGNPPETSLKEKLEKKNLPASILDLEADDVGFALTRKDEERLRNISVVSLLMHLWESPKNPVVQNLVSPINDMVENFNMVCLK